MYDRGATKFWNNVYKNSYNKTSNHVITVNGASGAHDFAEMWKVHSENLYSASESSKYRVLCLMKKSQIIG